MSATLRRRVVRVVGSLNSVPTWVLARAATAKGNLKTEVLGDCVVKYDEHSATIIPIEVALRALVTLPLAGTRSSIAAGLMPDSSPFGFDPSVMYGSTPIYDGLATYVVSSVVGVLASSPESISFNGSGYTYWGLVPRTSIPDPITHEQVVVPANDQRFGAAPAVQFCCLPGSGRLHQFSSRGEFHGTTTFSVPDDCIPNRPTSGYFFVPPYSTPPTVGWEINPGSGVLDFFAAGVIKRYFGAAFSGGVYTNYPVGNWVRSGDVRWLLMDAPEYVQAWEELNPTLSWEPWRATVSEDVAALDVQAAHAALTLSNRLLAAFVAGGALPIEWREVVWTSIPATRKVKRETELLVETIGSDTSRTTTLSYETAFGRVSALANGPTVTTLRPYGDEDPRAVRKQVLSGTKATTYDGNGVRSTTYSSWPGDVFSYSADAHQKLPVTAWTVLDGAVSEGGRVDASEVQNRRVDDYESAALTLVTNMASDAFTHPTPAATLFAAAPLLSYAAECSVPEIVAEYRRVIPFIESDLGVSEATDSRLQDGQQVSIILFGPSGRGIFGSYSDPSTVTSVDIFGIATYRYSVGEFVWQSWQPCHDTDGNALPTREEGGLVLPTPLAVEASEPLGGNAIMVLGGVRWEDVKQTAKDVLIAIRDPLNIDDAATDMRTILLALQMISLSTEGATP